MRVTWGVYDGGGEGWWEAEREATLAPTWVQVRGHFDPELGGALILGGFWHR